MLMNGSGWSVLSQGSWSPCGRAATQPTVAPDIVRVEKEGVSRRAYDAHMWVRHRPAPHHLNTAPYHTTPAGCRMPSHNRPKHPRVLAAHCQIPFSQDARQAKLQHV